MNDVTVNRVQDNKSFLSKEIIKLIHEHEVALNIISSSEPLMKLYKEKLEDLGNTPKEGVYQPIASRLTEGISNAEVR